MRNLFLVSAYLVGALAFGHVAIAADTVKLDETKRAAIELELNGVLWNSVNVGLQEQINIVFKKTSAPNILAFDFMYWKNTLNYATSGAVAKFSGRGQVRLLTLAPLTYN